MSTIHTTNSRTANIFNLIKQSLNGREQDYTSGSIRRAVILLAIPMMLEMIMESVFALVDIFFVSHLGKHATSTVGLTESVITIVYSIAIGIAMATTAIVARRIGEKNPDAASKAGMQAIMVSIALTLVISITGAIFAPDILRVMGAEEATVQTGTTYTRIVMGSSMVIMLLFLINGIFRGAGDAMMALKSLCLASICNIILCPLLIRGLGPIPAFGLTGAALATTIGRSIGVFYQCYHLFNGRRVIKFAIKHLVPDWATIRSLIDIAWPATLQFLIGSGSWIILARLVADTGHSEASAGYQIALRIVVFFILPAWGMSNAAATLVGQNLGAQKPERAEESVFKTARYNAIFMGAVSFIFLFGAPWIIGFFTKEEAVAGYAVQALRIISAGYIFYGIGMVMANAFNGAGDTKTPTIVNLFCFWFFQIPLAYTLAKVLEFGPIGVFMAIPIAETMIAIVSFILFRKGKWKLKKV
ncbi:MATE family efflux transporter [Ferruginibacter sp. HRS2-29]|uniref:MATE family efflux transporter n=1 Tax=Ferruginibacter sp. HRS2-29 TaxID=2487334 RepID=UPI0020CD6FDC|nr:MATE family efflux transporter [Ferruginibacter sp. HRS2-29]MCP9752941.1 MATE family efflux transporter [Ferruginibacter sp. HRS2-29]